MRNNQSDPKDQTKSLSNTSDISRFRNRKNRLLAGTGTGLAPLYAIACDALAHAPDGKSLCGTSPGPEPT